MLASRFSANASCVNCRSSGSSSASTMVIIFPSVFIISLFLVCLVVFGMRRRQRQNERGASARCAFGGDVAAAVINNGITVQKSTAAPLMLIDLSSPNDTYNNIFLANYAVINLNYALTRVPGVASVSLGE